MELIATTAHVVLSLLALIVSLRSTSVTHRHAKMGQHVLNIITNMNATVHMVFKESNVKISSTGVLKVLVKMERLVFNRRTNSDAIANQDGQEKCVTSKWFRAEMQHFAKK